MMQICEPHWKDCRQSIDDRGLSHLIAKSPEEVVNRVIKEIEGITGLDKSDTKNFDPLMSLHNIIFSYAIRLGGLYLMTLDRNGNHYCPLCEVDKHGGSAQDWIKHASDSVLEHCKANNLQG